MLYEGHGEVYCSHVMHKYKHFQEEEKVEYSINVMHDELDIQLARLLGSRNITHQWVRSIVVVSDVNRSDVVFQFGMTVYVETETEKISFEVSILEVLCRTDSTKLLEKIVLPWLTKGMKVVTKEHLHIWTDTHGKYHAYYGSISPDADVQS